MEEERLGRTSRPTGMPATLRRSAAILALLVLAGCAAAAGPSPDGTGGPGGSTPTGGSTPPGGLPGPVTLVRTGGFAGVRDTLAVQPDGRWRRTRRTGAPEAGRLTGAQREQLRRLAADPRLAAEATEVRPPTQCRDAFAYAVTVAGATVDYTDCPTDPDQPEAAAALVRLLADAVGW